MALSPNLGLRAAARAWAAVLLLVAAFLFAAPAAAQSFPPLTGRVVDAADLLQPAQEAELTQKLAALEAATHRQLVVATVPSLEGHDIQEYGVALGRAWGIGQRGANNGVILLVAPNEHKVGIEVGYGMEGVLTDALSGQIVRDTILPRFRANDFPGGIVAGTDAIIAQLQAPPEAAEANLRNAATQEQQTQSRHRHRGGSIGPLIIWGMIFLFIFLPALGAGLTGRRYGGRHRVSTWGPGYGGGSSGLGWMLMGAALGSMNRGGGSSWGGGGDSWGGGGGGSFGGGGGGFSGGGGSFGGGGASGGW